MNDHPTTSDLTAILLGLRLVAAACLGAVAMAVGSLWTLGAMAVARHRRPTIHA